MLIFIRAGEYMMRIELYHRIKKTVCGELNELGCRIKFSNLIHSNQNLTILSPFPNSMTVALKHLIYTGVEL